MIRFLSVILTVLALFAFVGCKPSGGNNANTAKSTPNKGHAEGDGHDHAHGEEVDDHDHDHGAEDDHGHGEGKELGSKQIGGFQVQATQFGDIHAGEEASFEVKLTALPAGVQPANVSVRVWIGTETGAESVKSKADYDADKHEFHAHVEAPAPLPTGSKWWVEIETAGQSSRGSFELNG